MPKINPLPSGTNEVSTKPKLKNKSYYKTLNEIPIPTRESATKIHPELWYIVYEENLLTPKIFRYGLSSEYFALKIAKTHLEGKRYNILKGDELLSFGITDCKLIMYHVSDVKKDCNHKYGFSRDLSIQRRKTLRTLYRRRMRRILRKLLKLKKKK